MLIDPVSEASVVDEYLVLHLTEWLIDGCQVFTFKLLLVENAQDVIKLNHRDDAIQRDLSTVASELLNLIVLKDDRDELSL